MNSCTDTLGSLYSPDIEQWLNGKVSSSTSIFKVCYFHHPPYSYSKHGSTPYVQFNYEALGIDLVIAGHNHVYEHIKPRDTDNLHYIINGLGGRKHIDLCDDLEVDSLRFDRICYNGDHGAMKAVADGDSLVLRFYALSEIDPIDEVVIYQ